MLDRYHTRFVRAGGALDKPAQDRLAAINERLASLGTQFGQNVLADEKAYALMLEEGDLAGLPDFARAAARAAARGARRTRANTPSRWRAPRARASCSSPSRRDLREKIFQAWIKRGENGGATDNRALIAEMVALRAERAKLLGFATLRRLPARRSDGQDPAGRAQAARRGLGPRARQGRESSATRCRR